jgi:hypothetical protein
LFKIAKKSQKRGEKAVKIAKKRVFLNLAINIGIALVISMATAKMIPLIYVGVRMGVGVILLHLSKRVSLL